MILEFNISDPDEEFKDSCPDQELKQKQEFEKNRLKYQTSLQLQLVTLDGPSKVKQSS